jgi:signal transduction protein with GAF and PtsI domain
MTEDQDRCLPLETLRTIAQELSLVFDESRLIEILLKQTADYLNAQGALIRLLDPDGQELVLAGSTGLSPDYLGKGSVQLEQNSIDQRALNNETVIVEDVTKEASYQYPQAAAAEGLHGLVIISIRVRDRPIGILRVYVSDVKELDEDTIVFLRTLADIGGIAVERIRLHQSLYRISEALNTTLELKEMLNRVLEATVREMELKAASVRLLDKKGQLLHLVAAYGLSQKYLSKGDVLVAKSPVDQRVIKGEVVVLFDVESEPGFQYPEEATQEGIHSVLVVPLRVKERMLGVLRVYSARPRHFRDTGIHFLTSIANLIALAIENAELYAALQARYEDLKLDLADWYRFLATG